MAECPSDLSNPATRPCEVGGHSKGRKYLPGGNQRSQDGGRSQEGGAESQRGTVEGLRV